MKVTHFLPGATSALAIAIFTVGVVAADEKVEKKTDQQSVEKPAEDVTAALAETVEGQEKMVISATEVLEITDEVTKGISLTKAEEKEEEKPSPKELALKDHREQLKIYDLDEDGRISEEEWKAANDKKTDRNDKFYLIDKDKDGQIDEGEAIRFLMQRVSLESTYLGESDDNGTEKIIEDGIEDHAPSELRVTLFSIPLGD